MRFPPANMQLRRAQLVLMLAVLMPTVAMTGVGIVLLVSGHNTTSIVAAILILTFCTSGITGYILGSIFVGKGASLVRVQNDFVSSISHELRTPVTSIRLLLESLATGRLEADEAKHVTGLLSRETDRLEVLVNRVLELSRLQTTYVFKRERLDMAAIVEESIAAFDAFAIAKPTPIKTDIEPGLQIVGDRDTLVRAIANLLTNAWKYTGDDKQISVSAHTVGRRIELLIRDNGIGIERGEQRAIFEQFGRGRNALRQGIPGIGLGLSFVRTIVHGHKGKIDFSSRAGETEFRIRLKKRREKPLPAELESRSTREVTA
ncbi:MAG TPA: HAMP domain-containing sensor histidine kinase [Kofleriaceae bacterium]